MEQNQECFIYILNTISAIKFLQCLLKLDENVRILTKVEHIPGAEKQIV